MNRDLIIQFLFRYFILMLLPLIFLMSLSSCDKYEFIDDEVVFQKEHNAPIELTGNFSYSLFANNLKSNQSAAVYGDDLFLVANKMEYVIHYDLRNRRTLYTKNLRARVDVTASGSTIYHCNQTTFGIKKYTSDDNYPIMYVSMRNTGRCFVEAYRILANANGVFSLSKVQTIYFPESTDENALSNVNVTINPEDGFMYTYSRNNNKDADNYLNCRISKFRVPSLSCDSVFLEDSDILDSYEIPTSAYNMQGGCIQNGKYYIARGKPDYGLIELYVIDLNTRSLLATYDMKANGFCLEPEGLFPYRCNIFVTSQNNIFCLFL